MQGTGGSACQPGGRDLFIFVYRRLLVVCQKFTWTLQGHRLQQVGESESILKNIFMQMKY